MYGHVIVTRWCILVSENHRTMDCFAQRLRACENGIPSGCCSLGLLRFPPIYKHIYELNDQFHVDFACLCTKNSIKNAPAPCGKSLEEAWHLVLKKSAGPDLPSGEAYGVLQKMDSQTTSLPLNKGTLRV